MESIINIFNNLLSIYGYLNIENLSSPAVIIAFIVAFLFHKFDKNKRKRIDTQLNELNYLLFFSNKPQYTSISKFMTFLRTLPLRKQYTISKINYVFKIFELPQSQTNNYVYRTSVNTEKTFLLHCKNKSKPLSGMEFYGFYNAGTVDISENSGFCVKIGAHFDTNAFSSGMFSPLMPEPEKVSVESVVKPFRIQFDYPIPPNEIFTLYIRYTVRDGFKKGEHEAHESRVLFFSSDMFGAPCSSVEFNFKSENLRDESGAEFNFLDAYKGNFYSTEKSENAPEHCSDPDIWFKHLGILNSQGGWDKTFEKKKNPSTKNSIAMFLELKKR